MLSAGEVAAQRVRMDESEPADIADGAHSEQQQDIPHPWPDLREMFEVVSSDSWQMPRVLCQDSGSPVGMS